MQLSKQAPPPSILNHDDDEDEEEQIGLLHQHHPSSSTSTLSTASAPEKHHPQPPDIVHVQVSWLRKIVVVLLLAWTIAFILHSFLAPRTYPDALSSTAATQTQASLETGVQSSEWVDVVDSAANREGNGEGDSWAPRARAVRAGRGEWSRGIEGC